MTDNIFLPKKAVIVRTEVLTETEKRFSLRLADGSKMSFHPGQILEVGLFGYGEMPVGIASSPLRKHTFDFVVRAVGRVSNAIHDLRKGDTIFIRGPLGRGFDVNEMKGHPVLIIAGGIGLCPTRSLIQYILGRKHEFGKFTLFFGAKGPRSQLFLDDLADWQRSNDVDYYETVDDPDASWKGNVGVITTLFQKTKIDADARVVICGPPVMYKFVIRELDKIGIPHNHIYVDLERRMKCGVGKCGHCQINDKFVCTDGPVFRFDEAERLEEAFR